MGNMGGQGKAYQYNQNAYANAGAGHFGSAGGANPCTIYSPVQPVPTGCHPSQVVVAGQHGQSMSQPNYTTGGYGSHASSAYQVADNIQRPEQVRKPKLRGSLSFGTEYSVSGTLLSPDAGSILYDSRPFREGFVSVTPGTPGGLLGGAPTPEIRETVIYDSVIEGVDAKALSFNDIHQSPLSLKGGVEYILNPKMTVFANAGYTHAAGADDAQASIISRLEKTTTTRTIDPDTGAELSNVSNTQFIPNVNVANITSDFSDLRKFDLEVGARKYFNPIYQEQGYKTITPFVGAAVGVSHVNDITYKTAQNQLFLGRAFEDDLYEYYDVPTAGTVNTLYDSDWLINGALTTGLEWQLTPKTALAFETGLKAYQSRDFVSGDSGDMNVVVPLTLRGSYNF